jgi:nicotinamide mononucleotide (NMN) deamidase PncC
MNADVGQLIALLHESPYRCVLAVTGGGAGAIAWLLSVPGGSRTVLEASVPYSEDSLKEYLGRAPESFCSVAASQEMAVRAQQRARRLAPGAPTAGVGCTASLVSDRPKRGDHRFHISVHTGLRTTTHSLTLVKGARDRQGEEYIVDLALLNALAEEFGVAGRLRVPLLPGEEVIVETRTEGEALVRFLAGETAALLVERDGRMRPDAPKPALLLPGAFNPVHEGHLRLAEIASNIVGAAAAFDLSVLNADKPPLADEEVRRRLAQFVWRAPVWLTRAPTYTEKAELFPDCVFVIGADTAARIVHPRFYGDSEERMVEALARFRAANCRFLTAGRIDKEGRFVGVGDLALPAAYRDLFQGVPEAAFRMDLSSTALRAGSLNR